MTGRSAIERAQQLHRMTGVVDYGGPDGLTDDDREALNDLACALYIKLLRQVMARRPPEQYVSSVVRFVWWGMQKLEVQWRPDGSCRVMGADYRTPLLATPPGTAGMMVRLCLELEYGRDPLMPPPVVVYVDKGREQ